MTEPTNRQRRRAAGRGQDDPGQEAEQQRRKLIDANTPQDVTSARAKNQRHGKVTADKWNQ